MLNGRNGEESDPAAPGEAREPAPPAAGRRGIFRFTVLLKFVVIAVLCNMPIAFTAQLYTAHLNEEITSARKERDGAIYLQAVWPVFAAALGERRATAAELAALVTASSTFDPAFATGLYSERLFELTGTPGPAAVETGQTFLNRIADNTGLGIGADVTLLSAAEIVARKLPEIATAAYTLNRDLATANSDERQAALSRFEYAGELLLDALGAADALNFNTEMTARMSTAQMGMYAAQRRLAAAAAEAAAAAQAEGDQQAERPDAGTMIELNLAYAEFQAALSDFWQVSADALTALLNNRIALSTSALRQDQAVVAAIYVFSFLLIWLLARSVSRRVRALMRGVERMQAGEIDAPVPNTNLGDEIGDMARAIEAFRLDLIDKREADEELRRHNVTLEAQRQELASKNIRFDATLNNMSHGLAMFDRDDRLAVWNQPFVDIYGISDGALKPGMQRQEVATLSVDKARLVEPALDGVAAFPNGNGDYHIELEDRRVLFVSQRAMRDGGMVITHEDITERRRAEEQIAYLAYHDSLTLLPNRLLFKNKLDQALEQRSEGDYVAVLCLDLDHFKTVNDTLGHPIGDAVLKAVSERLLSAVDIDEATVARLSGDEFAIVATGLENPTAAGALASHLIEQLGDPFQIAGNSIEIGTSIGIALAPNDGADSTTLLKNADLALYRAKGDGLGLHRFFEPAMDMEVRARRALEIDLRRALGAGEFELHYQPVVDLKTNRAVGCEALLRWHHAQRGTVPPAEFIPVAEETGLIVTIGEWVLRKACEEAAGWPADLRVAVNLSPIQFKSAGLLSALVSALSASGLRPSRLDLEITESVFLQDDQATLTTLGQMKELGVSISMDDFGTGFSSLSYLRSFPFDKIKIDQSFVRGLSEDAEGMTIVRAVAGLGEGLGMATTAEGVETEQQLELLRKVGYHEAQGFLFSRPRPAAEVPAMLARLGWPDAEAGTMRRARA